MKSGSATEAMSAEERRGALAAMPEVRLGQSMGRPWSGNGGSLENWWLMVD